MSDSSKNFKILRYPNGSHTLVDGENAQAMHSRIGPTIEAQVVYAERALIEKSLDRPDRERVLYDVGMGTGANVIAVMNRIQASESSKGQLLVFSFETKPQGLETALANLDLFPDLLNWEKPLRELLMRGKADFLVAGVHVKWQLLIGDFYSRVSEAPPPDFIFLDFYSPSAVPELWSQEKFRQILAKIGDRPAYLFTYAAATRVRLFLLAAGFFVGQGARTAAKNETTVAATRFELLENPLPRTWLAKLEMAASIAGPGYADARAAAAANPQWTLVRVD